MITKEQKSEFVQKLLENVAYFASSLNLGLECINYDELPSTIGDASKLADENESRGVLLKCKHTCTLNRECFEQSLCTARIFGNITQEDVDKATKAFNSIWRMKFNRKSYDKWQNKMENTLYGLFSINKDF